MDIKISFHNMQHSEPLEKHTRQRLEKLNELLTKESQTPPFFVEVWLKSNKLHPHHRAELHLKTAMLDLNSHEECNDLYVALDNSIDKMVKLIRKAKSKNRDKEHKAESEKTSFTDTEDKYTL